MNKYQLLTERKIRKLLQRTDWMVANVEGIFSDEQVAEILSYRQALRDINKEHPEDTTKWVFPEIPTFINPLDLE